MRIEFFQSEQLETVVDLFHEMSAHYNGADASDCATVRRHLADNILAEHSGVRLVIASEDHRAVGLASISILYPAPKERGQLFMKELYVVSDRRGEGIGSALMTFLARYAMRMGCSRFDWTVDATNREALDFYHQVGARSLSDKVYFRLAGDDLERFVSGS
ncbi:MAG: N-acetyltransferase [Nevskiales bacterium]